MRVLSERSRRMTLGQFWEVAFEERDFGCVGGYIGEVEEHVGVDSKLLRYSM